jgi:hypothetical protein
MTTLEKQLLINGVKNLKEFGYELVNEENILTDEVYSAFFERMLNENKGHNAQVDKAIQALLNKIQP